MNLPERVIVYDGQCHLCNAWLRFLPPHDPQARFSFCPMQTATGAELLRRHGIDPSNPTSLLYVRGGHRRVATDAIIRIVVDVGGIWRLAALLWVFPRPLRDAVYALIVRNRYRWKGRAVQCIVPSNALRRRFVEWPTGLDPL